MNNRFKKAISVAAMSAGMLIGGAGLALAATVIGTSITLDPGAGLQTGTTATDTALLRAYDTAGSYTTFATLTAGATPTMDLAAAVTIGGEIILDAGDLGSAADKMLYTTGADTFAEADLTAFARTILDDTDAATARGTLGATLIGDNIFTLGNPGATTFLRVNADASVITRSDVDFRTDLSLVVGTDVAAAGANGDITSLTGLTTDLAITHGGTGASTAAAAITNLGATTAGGNLFTLTNPSAVTFLQVNANNTVSALLPGAFRTAIGAGTGNGDLLASNNLSEVTAGTARTNLGLAIDLDVQAYDAGLLSIAGLTTLADRMIYTTASDTYAVATLTSFARTVLDDADAATALGTLGAAASGSNGDITELTGLTTDLTIAQGGTGSGTAADAFTALKQAASDTATGVVELATIAETNTGTDATRAITPDGLAGSNAGIRYLQAAAIDESNAAVIADGHYYFHIPPAFNGMDLVYVHALNATAGITGTMDVGIYNATNSLEMLSTGITIDTTEVGSDTAATPAVISGAADDVATNDVIRVDVDAIHTGTAANGLVITLGFQTP